jgi:hypothetical protein
VEVKGRTSGSPLQTQPAREVDPEVLAAMRARITKHTPAPVVEAVAQVVNQEETEDDRLLREAYRGDPVLFEAVLGRKPNEEKSADPRAGERRRRHVMAGAVL